MDAASPAVELCFGEPSGQDASRSRKLRAPAVAMPNECNQFLSSTLLDENINALQVVILEFEGLLSAVACLAVPLVLPLVLSGIN